MFMSLAFYLTRIVNARESAELRAHVLVCCNISVFIRHLRLTLFGSTPPGQLSLRYVSLVILRQLRYQ